MSKQILKNSPDLKRLQDEGYEVEIRGGYLLIHHIPYVNSDKQINYGILISELSLVDGTKTTKPGTHQIYFFGEFPCYQDGNPIIPLRHSSPETFLIDGIIGNHYFSNRPLDGDGKDRDYYQKVTRYAGIISAPAKSIDNSVTAKTFRYIPDVEDDSPFEYPDTNASRASITQINGKLANQRIAIIGLGGTGSYILDLLSKTPVKEIHLFDADEFISHNAFRAPGAASREQLSTTPKKVQYFKEIYSKMHRGIIPHEEYITMKNIEALKDMAFVFVSVDKSKARSEIVRGLLKLGIPFIDVGLGITVVDESLIGMTRVTLGTPLKHEHLTKRIGISDAEEDEYASNIQIADLNCLNAALAVIKWKKVSGFYQDLEQEHHSTYSINVAQLSNEDRAA